MDLDYDSLLTTLQTYTYGISRPGIECESDDEYVSFTCKIIDIGPVSIFKEFEYDTFRLTYSE